MSWWCDGCGENFSTSHEQQTVVCDMGHEHEYCAECWKNEYEEAARQAEEQAKKE